MKFFKVDIDYMMENVAREGDLKTENADRFIPIDPALLEMLAEAMEYDEGEPEDYIFHNEDGMPWSQNTFKRNWLRLMHDAGCTMTSSIPMSSARGCAGPTIL